MMVGTIRTLVLSAVLVSACGSSAPIVTPTHVPPTIGILQGHEGPSLQVGLTTLQWALPQYELREVEANEINTELRALLIIEPRTKLSEGELRRINEFVMRGGSLGVFGGAMSVELATQPGLVATRTGANLNRLLTPWGIVMDESIVADPRCGRLPIPDQSRAGGHPVFYPPSPVVTFDAEQAAHPVLLHLDSLPLFFVSPIRTTDAFEGVELLRSSDQAWLLSGEPVDLHIRESDEWLPDAPGEVLLGVATDARHPSAFDGVENERRARVLVLGTATPLRDEFLPVRHRATDAEIGAATTFARNAIGWLATR